ncbi:MAG: hypothetical protein NW900_02165, partial [Candidatus Blochmannia sp. A2]|nr:hypothetical protein [Candidatus Blochmannia sp. A2]
LAFCYPFEKIKNNFNPTKSKWKNIETIINRAIHTYIHTYIYIYIYYIFYYLWRRFCGCGL